VRVGGSLMEETCEGRLHWNYGFLGVSMKSVESDWFGHITWNRGKKRPKDVYPREARQESA